MQPIIDMLISSGITNVAIVDDAYDPPKRGDYTVEINDFFADVEADPDMMEEIKAFGVNFRNVNDITDLMLRNLWEGRSNLKALSAPFEEHLFPVIGGKLDGVNALMGFFNGTIGLNVTPFGVDFAPEKETFELIFIDYYLGPVQEKEMALARARNLVRQIYKSPSGKPKPLIVLMSSEVVNDELITSFVEDSGLIRGMFYFIDKADLSDQVKVSLKLSAFSTTIPNGYRIQHLLDAIESTASDISKQFISELKKLSIDDYAYIQRLSLQDDGQPLGDYLMWLFNSYYGHLFFEKNDVVKEKQQDINTLSISNLPLYLGKPSPTLSEIYHSALFVSNIAGLSAHPKSTKAEEEEHSYLHLGDIFVDDKNNVLLVINAQCDLSYAPDGKNRKFRPTTSIILVPGELHEVTSSKNTFEPNISESRTLFFKYNNNNYSIIWKTKEVLTKQYGKIRGWLKKENYVRVSRLRLPFALEIQNVFASELTRVGNPVAPPIITKIRLEGFYKNSDQKATKFIESNDGDVYIMTTKTGLKCFFTESFIYRFRECLDRTANDLTALLPNKKIEKFLADIGGFTSDCKMLREIWSPIEMPKSGKTKDICSNKISFSHDDKFKEGDVVTRPITLNVIF